MKTKRCGECELEFLLKEMLQRKNNGYAVCEDRSGLLQSEDLRFCHEEVG